MSVKAYSADNVLVRQRAAEGDIDATIVDFDRAYKAAPAYRLAPGVMPLAPAIRRRYAPVGVGINDRNFRTRSKLQAFRDLCSHRDRSDKPTTARDARMPIIAITIINSMRVKPRECCDIWISV